MQDRYGYLAALRGVFRARILMALEGDGGPQGALDLYLREQGLQRRLISAPERRVEDTLGSSMPRGAAFVAMLELPNDRMVALVVNSAGTFAKWLDINPNDLRRQISSMKELIDQLNTGAGQRERKKLDEILIEFHYKLIAPINDLLGDAHRQGLSLLGLSLDDAYAGVPFEALLEFPGAPRLVQSFIMTRIATPEALRLEPRTLASPERGALVVGAQFPASTWQLKNLNGVQTELDAIRDVLRLRPDSILIGIDSTRSRLLELLPNARWLHFAGHSLGDPRDPSSSLLILADEPTKSTALSVADLAKTIGARHLELAVLAGCETALSQTGGIAQALERGGIRVTIGSQWPIQDRASAMFFAEFYKLLAADVPPVQALHKTQLTFLGSGDPDLASPATWAAFATWGW